MSEDLDWEKIADADIDLTSRNCCAAKDARISSLEQTVAKAFLRVKELEEAVANAVSEFDARAVDIGGCSDGFCLVTGRRKGQHTNGGCQCWRDKYTAQRAMASGRKLRERLALCHATDPRADSPHRAVGALQSDDGDTR